MLTTRQNELLKLIVEDYIKTARPIGSKSLCDAMNCSSATIRSEMAELEEMGLLEKTHTSSGRIPSEKGYRYYVDHIMKPKELTGEDMLKLQTIFKNQSLVLSDAISKSMEIISELTNYTAIVLGTTSKNNRVSKIEVVPIDERKLIAIVVTDQGHVEYRNLNIEEQVSTEEIKQTVEIINRMIIGTPIDEVSSKLEFEVKPVIHQYIKQHEVLYNAFYNAFNSFTSNVDVKLTGTKQLLAEPEFNDVDKIREILTKFEDKEIIESIKEETSGINIYIGSENTFDDDVTIIKTTYELNGERGTIALIGPKRMDYDRVTALFNYLNEHLHD